MEKNARRISRSALLGFPSHGGGVGWNEKCPCVAEIIASTKLEKGLRAMKTYTIQYLDSDGNLKVAYVNGRNKEDAVRRFRREGK